MAKDIAISNEIEYGEEITQEEFKDFVDTLEKKDADECAEEGKDGFVDLYNYWTGAGNRRFQIKLSENKLAIGE